MAKKKNNRIERLLVAAKAGDADAQYDLGEMYSDGLGVKKVIEPL